MTTATTATTTPAAKVSVAKTIRDLHRASPDRPLTEIAKDVGKPARYVYAILYADRKKTADVAPATATPAVAAKKKPGRPRKTPAVDLMKSAPKAAAPAVDLVNQPPHYTAGGIETIDILKAKLSPAEFVGYLKGNVIKYSTRMGTGKIDAGKMAWYANRLAAEMEPITRA